MQVMQMGCQAFTADGDEELGAVRDVADTVTVYVENLRDFVVPLRAVTAVHSQKGIVDCAELDPELHDAINQAHDAEVPGL